MWLAYDGDGEMLVGASACVVLSAECWCPWMDLNYMHFQEMPQVPVATDSSYWNQVLVL